MAIFNLLSRVIIISSVFTGSAIYAGDVSVPNSTSVFSPAATSALTSAFVQMQSTGGTSIAAPDASGNTVSTLASGTTIVSSPGSLAVTVTPAGGASFTFTSGFVANLFASYYQ